VKKISNNDGYTWEDIAGPEMIERWIGTLRLKAMNCISYCVIIFKDSLDHVKIGDSGGGGGGIERCF
jgi:hypothetical protein